ncbi:hypothetical protein [Tenacibaculum crassostreae]|uniref:hypothetical protein n=1 Tax=Tenacibaculum crassostreae TaxID=502683 RepID=UPI0038940D81
MKNQIKHNWKLFLIASLTLGLAPFKPPHIVGKLQWIAGGNAFSGEHAMQFMDWFDVFLHGTPWLLLIISILLNLSSLLVKTDSE